MTDPRPDIEVFIYAHDYSDGVCNRCSNSREEIKERAKVYIHHKLCDVPLINPPPPAVNNGMIIELILFFILVLQHDLSSMNIRFLYFVF